MKLYFIFFILYFSLFSNNFNWSISDKSQELFLNKSSTWEVLFGTKKKYNYYLKGYKKGKKVRLDLFSKNIDEKLIYSLIIKNNFWYTINIKKEKVIYRPYEAPTKLTSLYFYFLRSRPQFLNLHNYKFLGNFQKRKEKFIFHKQKKYNSHKFKDIEYHVNINNYLISYFGNYQQEITFFNFIFTNISDNIFKTNGKWQDRSKKFKNSADWQILTYKPYSTALIDSRMINIRTKEIRRLPIRGVNAPVATFSKDRTICYAAVSTFNGNYHNLVKVNIQKNIQKNIPLSQKIQIKELKISPDDSRLAMIYSPLNNQNIFDKTYIAIIQLSTNKLIFVSQPMDCLFLNWSSNNSLVFQKNIKGEGFFLPTIIEYDLIVNIQNKLAVGHNPFIFKDSLFFINLNKEKWNEIDFKNEQKKYFQFIKKAHPQFVSVDEWLLIDYDKKLPKPFLYNFSTKKGYDISLQGIWQ